MTKNYSADQLLDMARRGLRDIGYHQDLLIANYSFQDFLTSRYPRRSIELAAFGQKPLSPRSACFGVTVSTDESADAIRIYQGFGAAQILALYPRSGQVGFWKVVAQGAPVLTAKFKLPDLPRTLIEHRNELSPEAVLRAKSIGSRHWESQSSLFDFDPELIPTLEAEISKKLDTLLDSIISQSKDAYSKHFEGEFPFREMAQLIFRLVAAKLLIDRQHPVAENWSGYDASRLIQAVGKYYLQDTDSQQTLLTREIQNRAWERLHSAFSFQNISVEILSYVYENTLVNDEARKKQGIHATPPAIAEYIVRHLPFENLDLEDCYVFEPFSGHAPFLTAALGRLRPLLAGRTESERHQYFRRVLSGMESDPFAHEVGLRSLELADNLNRNGWNINREDVYTSPKFFGHLKRARVVLCNPPYEKFDPEYRQLHSIERFTKGAEALRMVLTYPPQMLGFVLPRTFINGQDYDGVRDKVDAQYDHVEIVSLPDKTFGFSGVEPILIIAHGQRTEHPHRWSTKVESSDLQHFFRTLQPTWKIENPPANNVLSSASTFWYTPLQRIWDALSDLRTLGQIADVHRGIEYNLPIKKDKKKGAEYNLQVEENEKILFSTVPKTDFQPGIRNVDGSRLEPYLIKSHIYLNTQEEYMRRESHRLPWDKRKVIANAARIKGDRWLIAAAVDDEKLVCYQRFFGIWPSADVPAEVIAALLNGPIANAYLSLHQNRKWGDNEKRTVIGIPVPTFSSQQMQTIVSLVKDYKITRRKWLAGLFEETSNTIDYEATCSEIAWQIDAGILAAYNLPYALERELFDYFGDYERPEPASFDLPHRINALPAWVIKHSNSRSASQILLDQRLKAQAASELLESWLTEDVEEEENALEEFEAALDEDRLSYRKFNP